MTTDIYCIDASSLINLNQYYKRKVFSGLWDEIEEMVHTGRLIAPDEVRREIDKDDLLGPWAKKNKKLFRKPDQEQMDTAKDVIKHYPSLCETWQVWSCSRSLCCCTCTLGRTAKIEFLASGKLQVCSSDGRAAYAWDTSGVQALQYRVCNTC